MTSAAQRRQQRQRSRTLIFGIAGLGALLIAVAVLVGVGAAQRGQRAAIEVTGQPRLKVDRESIDLGDVRLGQTVQVAFVLTNVGDQALRLTQEPYIEVIEGC